MTNTRLVVALGALASIASPAFSQPNPDAITVQVVNDSGIPDDKVFLLLGGKSVTAADGTTYALSVSGITSVDMGATSPPATTGTPLACKLPCSTPIQPVLTPGMKQMTLPSPYSGNPAVPVYYFTMTTVGSGVLFVSHDTAVTYPPAPTVTASYRFQPLEFSYSKHITSNGDLTSIDFYGIPLELTTFANADTALKYPLDKVTYYTSTASLLEAMRAADPALECAFLRTDGKPFDRGNPLANFARIVGPNQVAAASTPPVTNCPATPPSGWTGGTWPPSPPPGSPWPYPSFAAYLDNLAASGYTFAESDRNVVSAYTYTYTGAIQKMAPVTVVTATTPLTTTAGTLPAASAPLSVIAGTATGAAALTMSFAPSTIAVGGQATLTITLPNTAGAAASLTAPFYSVMPPGVILGSLTAQNSCTNVELTPAAAPTQIALAKGASIPSGGCTIAVTITSSRMGTVTGATSVLQANAYTVATPAAAPLTVVASGAAAVASAFSPATIAPNGTATLTITLPNSTSSPLTLTAPFAATLPAGVTASSGNTGNCPTTGGPLALASGAAIPPGGCTIVVTVTSTAQGTTASCLDPRLAADGWLIKLTGTTATTSPLPSNADVCIPLPRRDNGYGSADFNIYGAPQNCETLGLAVGGVLQPCTDADAAALGSVTNSVYGWMQADVLAALNFGYMQGTADATFGGGQSSVWYGIPPVQYPFGQARATNDGHYNGWAAMMYNHSDAYGFAFSDRNGRPSPDIAFPVGGTLRIWILPDTRLDAPAVTATPGTCSSTAPVTCPVALSWPAVANADHYVVTWSPPYAMQSTTVAQPTGATASHTVQGLVPGTPYTFTVRAHDATTKQASFELPVYATTQGTPPPPAPGAVEFQFGLTWSPPAFLATAGTPIVTIAGQQATDTGSGVWTLPARTPITIGPAPASTSLNVLPYLDYTGPYTTATVAPPVVQPAADGTWSAVLTVLLGNGGNPRSPKAGVNITMPAGLVAQLASTTCVGVVFTPPDIVVPANAIPNGGCTIVATLSSATPPQSPATYFITVPELDFTDGSQSLAADVALTVSGANPLISQTITTLATPAGQQPTVGWNQPATLTTTLGNATGADAVLIEPYVDHMPLHVTIASVSGTSTCSGIEATPYRIVMPAGTTIPAAGCTIVATIMSDTPGTYTNTTGTALTYYPTQSFPLSVSLATAAGTLPVWSANFYLTMMGVPDDYSVGPCLPSQNCMGSGLSNPVQFDTLKSPNFLERGTGALAVAGGVAAQGPPFGSTPNAYPQVTATFLPAPGKLTAQVVFPGAGSAP